MGLKRVSWVRRYQGQCRALRPLGHQGYRLRSYKKRQPLCSGYTGNPCCVSSTTMPCMTYRSTNVLHAPHKPHISFHRPPTEHQRAPEENPPQHPGSLVRRVCGGRV